MSDTLTTLRALQKRIGEANAERLRQAEAGEPYKAALAAAYQDGWKACANELQASALAAVKALSGIRKDAINVYYGYEEGAE